MNRRLLSVALTAIVMVLAIVPVALAQTVPPEIPEPGSLVLLGTGIAGLAGYVGLRWRARK